MTLTFTGERFLPECAGEMVYEHWHRYLLAQKYVTGKRVLDAASGEGYGASLLAKAAVSVVGVDISPEATRHATHRYAGNNLCFVTASVAKIPLPDASFDVIVSFETIEHMTEHVAFMQEIERLLAPGGMLIISSPNRPEYTDKTGYHNEFHVKELDRGELKMLLDRHLPAQKWFAQRPAFHSMIWPIDAAPTTAEALTADGDSGWPAELYFLVFAARQSDALQPVTPAVTLVTDREQSVYAEWSRTYRENRMLHERVGELEAAARAERVCVAEAPVQPAGGAPKPDTHPTAETAPRTNAINWLLRLWRRR